MGLFFGMVLTISTKQQKYIVVSKWSHSEMTRNNLHIPVDNAKIDIMSILKRCKKIIVSCRKSECNSANSN